MKIQKCFTNTKNVYVLQNNLNKKRLQCNSNKGIGLGRKIFNYRKFSDPISKCGKNGISTQTEENEFGATVQFFWKHVLHQRKKEGVSWDRR